MKYEKPIVEIIITYEEDVITESLVDDEEYGPFF